jgi:hypothetical protein
MDEAELMHRLLASYGVDKLKAYAKRFGDRIMDQGYGTKARAEFHRSVDVDSATFELVVRDIIEIRVSAGVDATGTNRAPRPTGAPARTAGGARRRRSGVVRH